jgi:hypothetical protein
MELRNGKRLPPVPLNRVNRRKPQRFRLLDLPTELRLMIFGYVIGRHQNVYWTMTYESTPTSGYVLALGHVDDLNYIRCNANLHQRHLSLLHTCRQVSEEALTWHAHHSILNFKFYRGNAVLEIHNANHADEEEIAKLKEASRSTCYSYSRHFHEKTLTSSQVLSIHFPLPCLTRAMFRVTRRISGPNLLVDARTTRWVLLNYTRIGTIAGV